MTMTARMQIGRLVLLGLLAAGCGAGPTAIGPNNPPQPTQAAKPPAPRAPVAHSAPVHKRGGRRLTVEVGPSGGTLELGNGARLVIPEGALKESVEITFSEGRATSSFNNKDYERAIGPIVSVSPRVPLAAPLMFSVPVSKLPQGFSAEDIALAAEVLAQQQRGYRTDNALATRWDYWPAGGGEGRAQARLDELPGMRLQFVVSRDEDFE